MIWPRGRWITMLFKEGGSDKHDKFVWGGDEISVGGGDEI